MTLSIVLGSLLVLVMIYLLAVVIVALFFGRWPLVFAAVINVSGAACPLLCYLPVPTSRIK
ncbi:hypothetical protein H4F66_03815 [Pectobacterium parmentieri]|nr:hypothetical protein [Pectobacterium parmentieri]MBN3176721.1 hypothetical protein [Pectobacterium parmentieri]POW30422.1 two-component system sensor histidine kinase KdbD [Pectobacterium parmentieri]QPK22234.1 hypothetical protein PB20LOC_012450 [Pectobacterium parmentieri]QRN32410.1 hypothetical protein IG623_14900 [Pectobacterium parmentieri]